MITTTTLKMGGLFNRVKEHVFFNEQKVRERNPSENYIISIMMESFQILKYKNTLKVLFI